MLKRSFDVIVGLLCSFVIFPIAVIIIISIKIDSSGPIIFSAYRVGRNKKLFKIYKFRTMYNKSSGPGVTALNDERITRIGKRLRRYRLDEIPQLYNIIKGEMSIVGPRPEDPKYVDIYKKKYKKILTVRPGAVSPSWILFRDEKVFFKIIKEDDIDIYSIYTEKILPKKVEEDIKYVDNISFVSDMKIIFCAIISLFSK